MSALFIVGDILAIPPWGMWFGWIGIGIQLVGVALIIGALINNRRSTGYWL